MSFYLRTQKRHLIICSEAETERQVPNHACDFTEWLCVCARYIFLLGRAIRMLTLWQLLLTGVNTLSTSLYTVSTSLLSVWWKPKWQDGDCRPPGLGLVFISTEFSVRLWQYTWINSEHPSHFIFCADTQMPMNWCSTFKLKHQWVKWLHCCYFCSGNVEYMVLSLCITAKWERFVSLHRHCKGHKLSFVIHNRVTKSKRKFGCLFTVFYLKSWLFCSLKLDFLSPRLPFLFNKRLLAWNFCRVFNDKCPWKKKINWREMKFPSGWKLRRRCGGLPSKSHKLCSSYKKQHVPKVLWTYARGPFSSLIIARAIKVLNSHAKCHQAPPVPFQKWYRHPCMWTTVCFAKVNRLVKYSSFFSFPPALWGGRNDLINNADLMYEIKYNLYSANVIQRSLL